MKLVHKHGVCEIWVAVEPHGPVFYAYRAGWLVRACPSLDMAHEVLA